MFSHLLLLVLLAASGHSASIGGRYARHVYYRIPTGNGEVTARVPLIILVPVQHPFYSQGSAMSYGAFFGQGPGASFAANNVIAGVGNTGHPGSPAGHPEPSAEVGATPEIHDAVPVPDSREVNDQEDPAPVLAVMMPVMPVIADETEEPAYDGTTEASEEGVSEGSPEEDSSEEPVSEEASEQPHSEESTEEPLSEEGVTEEHQSLENTEEPLSQEITEEPLSQEITTEPLSEYITEEPVSDEPASEEPTSDEPASEEPTSDEPASDEPASEEPISEEPVSEEVPEKEAVVEEQEPEQPAEPETNVSHHDSTPEAPKESQDLPETAHKEHVDIEAPKKKATPKEQSLPGHGKPSFPGFGGAFGWNVFPEKFFGGATPHSGVGSGSGSSSSARASSSSFSKGNGASFASSHASASSGSSSGQW